MRLTGLKLVAIMASLAALPACVPDPALVASGAVKAPEPKLITGIYGAKQDGSFAIPAVPVEKVPTQFQRQEVYYPSEDAVGTIIIDAIKKNLHLVTGKNKAIRYGIGVGRSGFEWSGEAIVNETKQWPTWRPPAEMIDRKPELAKYKDGQPGGLTNPLGARALYLTTNGVDYGYRIHGTPEWNSIGTNASSGCIRMFNQDVIDLSERAVVGAKVVVLTRDGSRPTKLTLPPPAPKKPKPVEAVVEPALPELPAPPPLDPALISVAAPVVATPAAPAEPATDN